MSSPLSLRLTPTLVLAALALFAALAVVLSTPDMVLQVAAISITAVVFFALRVVPEALTSLWSILAFLAIGAAPKEVIFSGFSTGGFWLLFSGLIIGGAITQTGLGKLVAGRIFQHTGTSYSRAVILIAITGMGLGMMIPSTIPRVIVLVPIAMALAEVMGYEKGSRGQIALVITATTSTLLPTYTFLTANMPTIIHYGALETLYGLHPSYADYFVHQLPVNLVRFALILALLLPLARTMPVADTVPDAPVQVMTAVQKRLAALLCLSILLWASDTWHGISPAWVALGVATVVLLPATGLLNKDAMKTNIDLSPAFFLAGVFAISAVVAHIGLNTELADAILPRLHLGEGSQFRDLYAIVGFSTAFSHLTTAPAAPVVLAPLAMPMAEAAGWPVSTVAMAQIIGIATPLLPYQAPPLIIGLALSGIPSGMLTRVCIGIGIGVFVIGLPLTYLWWQLIGAL